MESQQTLNHLFLVATPTLQDPTFKQAVVYIYEHNEAGAMGFLVNKPLNFNLGSVLEHLDLQATSKDIINHTVLMGGPVGQENGFIICPNQAADEQVNLSSSKEALQELADGQGPEDFVVLLGYATWDAGQLEDEIANNDWFVAPFDISMFFDVPIPERWRATAKLAGVDIANLSNQIGHA